MMIRYKRWHNNIDIVNDIDNIIAKKNYAITGI
jgi:hypothetical protein